VPLVWAGTAALAAAELVVLLALGRCAITAAVSR
jgi:hypothetical protein